MRAVRNRRLRQSEPRGSPAGSVIGLQNSGGGRAGESRHRFHILDNYQCQAKRA